MSRSPLSLSQPPDLERFDEAFVRRQKALARTSPIHDLEANKSGREGDWSAYDLRGLALAGLDYVMEHMGLEYGATYERIVEELAPLVGASNPRASSSEQTRVASAVLSGLLNDRGRREAFQAVYSDYGSGPGSDGGHTRRVLSFRLLQEVEAPDGSVVLRATDEAINLFFSALDHDIEDAQAAAEAVLRSQMSRGLLDRAVATAREARFRSVQFGEKVASVLRIARRDLRQVDWGGDVSPMLDNALTHLKDRTTAERELVRSARGQLDRADPLQLPAAADLVQLVQDCQKRHVNLQKQLIDARPAFMAEQERQAFSPQSATPLPELERELLMPLLVAPREEAGPVLEEFSRAAAGPCVHRHVRLSGLVDLLLQPRRESHDGSRGWDEPELVQFEVDPDRFTAADEAVVHSLLVTLELPQRLSSLLDAARDACGCDDGDHSSARPSAVTEMMRLVALYGYSPEVSDSGAVAAFDGQSARVESGETILAIPFLRCQDDSSELEDSEFGGADLLLSLESKLRAPSEGSLDTPPDPTDVNKPSESKSLQGRST